MKVTLAALFALMALGASTALAQNPQTVKLCTPTSGTACAVVTSTAPLPVTATLSGTSNVAITSPLGGGVQATAVRTTLSTDSPGIIALGQTTKSASVPVTIASDQVGISSNKIGRGRVGKD